MTKPNWEPAKQKLPVALLYDLMHMGTVSYCGHEIEQYKHRTSRRYINLDQYSQAWEIKVDPKTGEVGARRLPFNDALAYVEGKAA